MGLGGTATIVLDTSVLLNFVNIGRLELLGRLGVPVVLPEQVIDEIRRPGQREMVEDTVAAGILELHSIHSPEEVALFAHLRAGGRLGAGECAVLAVALTRHWVAGLQDRRARLEGQRRRKDLVLTLIRAGRLTVEEADGFLVEWATRHRFRARFNSFGTEESTA